MKVDPVAEPVLQRDGDVGDRAADPGDAQLRGREQQRDRALAEHLVKRHRRHLLGREPGRQQAPCRRAPSPRVGGDVGRPLARRPGSARTPRRRSPRGRRAGPLACAGQRQDRDTSAPVATGQRGGVDRLRCPPGPAFCWLRYRGATLIGSAGARNGPWSPGGRGRRRCRSPSGRRRIVPELVVSANANRRVPGVNVPVAAPSCDARAGQLRQLFEAATSGRRELRAPGSLRGAGARRPPASRAAAEVLGLVAEVTEPAGLLDAIRARRRSADRAIASTARVGRASWGGRTATARVQAQGPSGRGR